MSTRYRKVLEVMARWRREQESSQMHGQTWSEPMEFAKEPLHFAKEPLEFANDPMELVDADIIVQEGGRATRIEVKMTGKTAKDGGFRIRASKWSTGWVAEIARGLAEAWIFLADQIFGVFGSRTTKRQTPPVSNPKVIGLLKAFRWFCDRDSREIVDLVLADLTRDINQMTEEGRGRWFVRAVVWRHVLGTLGSVSWNAFHTLLKKIATTLGLINKISR